MSLFLQILMVPSPRPACLRPSCQVRRPAVLAHWTMARKMTCRLHLASVYPFTWTLRRLAGQAGLCLPGAIMPTTARAPVPSLWVRAWGRPTTPPSSPSSTPWSWSKASRLRAASQTSSSPSTCCTLMMRRMWCWNSTTTWWLEAAVATDVSQSHMHHSTRSLVVLYFFKLWPLPIEFKCN